MKLAKRIENLEKQKGGTLPFNGVMIKIVTRETKDKPPNFIAFRDEKTGELHEVEKRAGEDDEAFQKRADKELLGSDREDKIYIMLAGHKSFVHKETSGSEQN
jgi:hypothetical protein